MDTRLLRIFMTVATHGSLAAASRELHLTASALSYGLKDLEANLGVRLFDRVGGRLLLNQAGEQLLREVKEPLARLEKAASSLKALGKWGVNSLRVGAPEPICQHLLPLVLRELGRSALKLNVVLEMAEGERLLGLVRDCQVDLAIDLEAPVDSGLASTLLFQDELLFALPREHPWVNLRSLSPEQVRTEPILTEARHSASFELVRRFFLEQEIELNILMELGSSATLRELVKQRLAIAILPPWVFGQELRRELVVMRPLGLKPLRRRWTILHRAGARLGWTEEQFLKHCRRQVAALRTDRKDLPHAV